MRGHPWTFALTVLALAACSNAGQQLTAPTLATGGIQVLVVFDRDASHSYTVLDTVVPAARVALVVPGGQDTIRTQVTDAHGIATFDSLPVGTYRVVIDRHALADSVGVVAGDTGTVRLVNEADSLHLGRIVRLGYTEATLAAARTLPAGKRVMVRGVVSAPLQFFHDSSAFLVDTSGTIRITGARPQIGSGGNNIGDSVLVLGTTGKAAGQGVLVGGLFVGYYAPALVPVPRVTTVADALTALGGALDATLIQLANVTISDTVAVGADFVVKVADPAAPAVTVNVVIDQLLAAPHTLFIPGRTGSFKGVLVPVGDGTWQLRVRTGSDVTLN